MNDPMLALNDTAYGNPNVRVTLREIAEKVGGCIDTSHSFVAQESVGEAIMLTKRAGGDYPGDAGRLFHLHFNDNPGHWDDDMIVGVVRNTTYLETLYWLDRCGYAEWLSMDQHPYREDAAGATGEGILWLTPFDAMVPQRRTEIDATIAAQDGVATSRFLRSVLDHSDAPLVKPRQEV